MVVLIAGLFQRPIAELRDAAMYATTALSRNEATMLRTAEHKNSVFVRCVRYSSVLPLVLKKNFLIAQRYAAAPRLRIMKRVD